MPSSYPPGVTGNEPEIAGPDEEGEETRWCDECEQDTLHLYWRYGKHLVFECYDCLHETDEWIGPDNG